MGVKKDLDVAKKAIETALASYEAKKNKIAPDLKKLKDALKAVAALIDKAPFDGVKAKSLINQATGAVTEAENANGNES